jgi:hypothetical protein
VPLAAHVSELQERILRNLTLQGHVVLFGGLSRQGLWIIAEQLDWTERGEVDRCSRSGIQNSMEWIWVYSSILSHERRIEKWVGEKCASTKRRLCRELRWNQFFHSVVEGSPSEPDAEAARASRQFC